MIRLNAYRLGWLWLPLFLFSVAAKAWNKPTHMAIGAIAYDRLQQTSPRKLARVVALLRQHPEARTRWAFFLDDPTLSEEKQNRYLLMMAARWADDVRGTWRDHPTWHYINYVYNPTLGIARTDSSLATGENILQAYEQNRQLLTGNAPDSAKAIALCWLFHLTGDVHMPLHTAALISPTFPEGDRGGNLFKIKVSLSNPTLNLHAFWDGMLLNSDEYSAVSQLADQVTQPFPPRQVRHRSRPDITGWSKESFELARSLAYLQGKLQPGTDTEGALLPPDYLQTMKPIAERQVALAGFRLADELFFDLKKK